MNNDEIVKVEAYLRKLFKTEALELKRSPRQDMVEVLMDEEFIATLTKDDEDGEVSYNLSMAILDFDLSDDLAGDEGFDE
jgi:hypothetical protein